jgi:hypothetical protein
VAEFRNADVDLVAHLHISSIAFTM